MRGKNEDEDDAGGVAGGHWRLCAAAFYFHRCDRGPDDGFWTTAGRLDWFCRKTSAADAVAMGSGVERGDLRDAADRRRALFCPVALWPDETSAMAMGVDAAAVCLVHFDVRGGDFGGGDCASDDVGGNAAGANV